MPKRFRQLSLLLALMAGMIMTGWGSGFSDQAQAQTISPSSNVPNPGGLTFTRGDWVYFLALGQSQPRMLAQGRQPAFSPDGRLLAFVRGGPDQGDGKDLLVLDLATGQSLTLVSASQDRLDSPSWSPQGHLLAFISGLKQINIIKPDGSGRQTIFAVPGGSFEPPVWTSGGKSLVVTDLNFLFQIDLTGKQLNKTPLTSFTGKPDAVSSVDRFLPNPIELQLWAFTMTVPGTPKFDNTFHEPLNALFLFDVRTQKRTRLTPPDMLAMSPCWSRDGRVLYFSGYREPHYQDKSPFRIYRINKNGTGLTELVKGENPSQ